MKKKLLAICYEFAPVTTPTGIRTTKLLSLLTGWEIEVITVEAPTPQGDHITLNTVSSGTPTALLRSLTKLKLDKVREWVVWPDDKIFWILPALRKAMQIVRVQKPDAILVFMMPYASGIIGLWLKRLTGLPVILNLDDSPTCTDMHPFFPSRLHYFLTRRLEDMYVQKTDATIYVSEFNRRMVESRQPERYRPNLHLIRYGADPADFALPAKGASPEEPFRVVYLGGMNGWYQLTERPGQKNSLAKRLFRWWTELGRLHLVRLDQRGSSPVFLGQAIQAAIAQTPDWKGRVQMEIYGNRYPQAVVKQVLETQGIDAVVSVSGPVPNVEAIGIASRADLLFMTLPVRKDGTSGGRISAKTYEYLMTDRPILAALPRGENWDFLEGKPGVWLVAPDDIGGMARVVAELAAAKFAGSPQEFDRSALRAELSYQSRAAQLAAVLDEATAAVPLPRRQAEAISVEADTR